MKKLFLALWVFTAVLMEAAPKKDIKILTIGNSFSWSVMPNLNKIVKADPELKLTIVAANMGGCSFKRHWECYEKKMKQYGYKGKKYDLAEMLKLMKWDYVTIQQASHDSWNLKTYYPYADNIVKLVRELAPQAEIVVQQTWSYRCDDGRFNRSWKFDQTGMYDKLTACYTDLAKKYNFTIIPSGYAVQLSRKAEKNPFKPFKKDELAKYEKPAVPSPAGDVVGKYVWRKNKKTNTEKLTNDSIHLNARGEYMQACVWFYTFYGSDRQIKYVPENIADAKHLQEIACKAVKEFLQVKKLDGTLPK